MLPDAISSTHPIYYHLRRLLLFWRWIIVAALMILTPHLAQAASPPDAQVVVNVNTVINPDSPRLLGTSFDGRSSLLLGGNPAGYYSPADGSLLPEVAPLWNQIQLTSMRYPGNAVNKLNWQEAIGPIAGRPLTDIGAGPQKILFGFDEFMAMAQSRGVPVEHVQIMINLYSTYNGQTPAENAADWVEYANAPYDPTGQNNPNGGVDWAAVRAANGYTQPYGIKIWNIGNEPWGQTEFNMNVISYTSVAADFMTRMKQVDPSIKITLPAAGAPTFPTVSGQQRRDAMTVWDTTLLQTFGDDIYGLSQHIFYDNSSCRGVSAAQQAVELLAQQIVDSGKNVRLLIGDHAHSITSASTVCTQPNSADFAMQWQGAVTSADFLMMLAGEPAVERANFWIWGMPAAVWHPIRRNNDGTYTLMPLAGIYELLGPLMLRQAISAATTSPASADGVAYSVRAGAFQASNQNQVSVVVVNRDQPFTHRVQIQGLDGYSLQQARLLTADQPDSESFTAAALSTSGSPTEFDMPGQSILLLEYNKIVADTQAVYLPLIQK
jgi:alpha-L-arabinofuranosidase